ncbi:hypothetical protein GCM10020258_45710 [Sphingomonas yabuuchiae]
MARHRIGYAEDQLRDIAGQARILKAAHDRDGAGGVSSLGFRMTEQPAAMAGEILRTGFITGKFQAQKAATGPTGWCSTSERVPVGRGRTRP